MLYKKTFCQAYYNIIRFLKPARTSLIAKIKIHDEFDIIHHELQHKKSIERTYTIEWKDKTGATVAYIEKVLYFKKIIDYCFLDSSNKCNLS
jgi:hypothetical protein